MIAFLLAILVTEAVVEIFVDSELLAPVRAASLARFPRGGILLNCGYCLSVWVGVGASYALGLSAGLGLGAFEPLALGLAVHRLSNVCHEAVRRFLGRMPLQLVLVRRELRVESEEVSGPARFAHEKPQRPVPSPAPGLAPRSLPSALGQMSDGGGGNGETQ